MEDNLEKQRFIAQYWGQPIMLRMEMVYSGYPPEPDHEEEVIDIVDGNTIEYYLKGHAIPFFKSLKDITDEDALHIAKMSFVDTEEGRKLWTPENGRDDVLTWLKFSEERPYQFYYNSAKIDYLRSRSYLLPFNGLPPEDLLKRGWAKIREV